MASQYAPQPFSVSVTFASDNNNRTVTVQTSSIQLVATSACSKSNFPCTILRLRKLKPLLFCCKNKESRCSLVYRQIPSIALSAGANITRLNHTLQQLDNTLYKLENPRECTKTEFLILCTKTLIIGLIIGIEQHKDNTV